MDKRHYLILSIVSAVAVYFAKPLASPGYEVVSVILGMGFSLLFCIVMFIRLGTGVNLFRTAVLMSTISISFLGAYMAVYSNTVFDVSGQKILLPVVPTAELRDAYLLAGGRRAAIERFGPALAEEVARGPYLTATAMLLVLMFSGMVASCSSALSLVLFSLLRSTSGKSYKLAIRDQHGGESHVDVSINDQESIGSFIDTFTK
jgi:hypothetical protein